MKNWDFVFLKDRYYKNSQVGTEIVEYSLESLERILQPYSFKLVVFITGCFDDEFACQIAGIWVTVLDMQ